MTRFRFTRLARYALFGVLIGATAFSIGGMLLMRFSPAAVAAAGPLLPWLMKVPTWLYMAALPTLVFLTMREATGWRRGVAVLLWGSAVGLAAELLGTTTGWPFGAYAYGDLLGAKILGHVPVSIPPSWYAMGLVSFALAGAVTASPALRIVTGAAYMVLWDVALDPAMSYGFPAWVWQVEGQFYGMPLLNLAGWFVTAAVIMAGASRILEGRRLEDGVAVKAVWLAGCALPLGISAVRGMWWAVAIALPAVILPLALPLWRGRAVAVGGAAFGESGDAVPAFAPAADRS